MVADVSAARTGVEASRSAPAAGTPGAVVSALERIASVQMQGIAADHTDDPRKYGLDRPSATINVGLGSSKATLTLGKTEDAVVYAKDAARPMIFTVAPTLTSDLFKDVSDYRRKDLFDSRSFTTDKVTFVRGGETITLEKSTAKDGKETWKNSAGKDVDAMKVDDLLSKLDGLRAGAFQSAAEPALKNPALSVTAQFDSNKTETVVFARSGAMVVAGRTDEPGSATVETMAFDELMKGIDALK